MFLEQKANEIDYKIYGEEMQFVEIELDPQEGVVAESGSFMMMDTDVKMNTIFGDGSKNQGIMAPTTAPTSLNGKAITSATTENVVPIAVPTTQPLSNRLNRTIQQSMEICFDLVIGRVANNQHLRSYRTFSQLLQILRP